MCSWDLCSHHRRSFVMPDYRTYLQNQGSLPGTVFNLVYVVKSEYLRECSASRVWRYMHQLWIMSLVKCWVYPAPMFFYLTFPLYQLRWHRENYCDCAMVHSDEHLSRENRKLTVMIRRELVNHSMTQRNLRDSSAWTKERFLGHVHGHTRGYIVAPPSNSYG